jgi:NAD(P)H-hydrate epimerase
MPLPVVGGDRLAWITVEQMREVDRVAIEVGLSLVRMMENAGANLAALARELLGGDVAERRIAVLAGPGGNGGGGLVAARRLAAAGAEVEVRLGAEPERLAPVPAEQLAILAEMGVPAEVGVGSGSARLADGDLVIDALLGYSGKGAPRGEIAALIEATAGARVLALDNPSGLELESGTVHELAVRAAATMTLALPKQALRDRAAREWVGELYLADISVPPVVYERLGIAYETPFAAGPIVRVG